MNTQVLSSDAPDLRLELRSRNNVLWHAIFDVYASVAEFCRAHHVEQSLVGQLLNLKLSPYNRRHVLRPIGRKLCDSIGYDAETLFPPRLYTGKFRSLRVAEVESYRFVSLRDAGSVLALPPSQDDTIYAEEMSTAIRGALGTLTPREKKIIELRFGLNGEEEQTLDQVGNVFHVGKERVRQIEIRALRKLRKPSRARRMQPFVSSAWTAASREEAIDTPDTKPLDTNPVLLVIRAKTINVQFVAFVEAHVNELRTGSWTVDDTPAPPGGLNPTIYSVRVTSCDRPDFVRLVVSGFADKPL